MQLAQSQHAFYSAPIAGAPAVNAEHVKQFLAIDNIRSSHLRVERDRIAKLRGLNDDWDGRGSAKPSLVAAEWTERVVLPALYDAVSTHERRPWITPHITSSEDGEIVLEWWNGSRKITMYISESEIEYILVWGINIEKEMKSQKLTDVVDFRQAWAWLYP